MTCELKFEKFRSIARLNKPCTITEKIDGTNASILFDTDGSFLIGSRKRQIWPNGTPGKDKICDNAGFGMWVTDNHEELFEYLGPGRHFGEWAGAGIGRRYGMNEKRFYLFNTFRFNKIPDRLLDTGLDVAPIILEGQFSTELVERAMDILKNNGSFIADFKNPEGIVVYHHALRAYGKVTFEYDEGKWSQGN